FMKETDGKYAGRRKFIWESLAPAFRAIEKGPTGPSALSFEEVRESCSSDAVQDAWQKIHDRREADPEGAITAARSLLESTCKYVLDELSEGYSPTDTLPALYKKTAKALNLGADQHE